MNYSLPNQSSSAPSDALTVDGAIGVVRTSATNLLASRKETEILDRLRKVPTFLDSLQQRKTRDDVLSLHQDAEPGLHIVAQGTKGEADAVETIRSWCQGEAFRTSDMGRSLSTYIDDAFKRVDDKSRLTQSIVNGFQSFANYLFDPTSILHSSNIERLDLGNQGRLLSASLEVDRERGVNVVGVDLESLHTIIVGKTRAIAFRRDETPGLDLRGTK